MINEEERRCIAIVGDAVGALGSRAFWRDRERGGVFVKVGVTLRQEDLVPLVRHYPHGRRGYEFATPITEFLERFEPTETPLHVGVPLAG